MRSDLTTNPFETARTLFTEDGQKRYVLNLSQRLLSLKTQNPLFPPLSLLSGAFIPDP